MPQATQTRRIVISVDANGAQGLKELADKLGGVNRNTKELADGFKKLMSFAQGFLAAFTVREIADFSDEIQNLNNRLLSMGGSQEQATQTMHQLVNVARETNQSLEGISQSYFRMSQALKDVGVDQKSMIELTKTIANTFRLSGASTEEAKNATIQLGQAFSLGVLRGQDLRSVMSQNVVLTRLLRKEFGNDLVKQAEKGLITVSKLMSVLFKNMKDVDAQAKLMSATFGQSFTKALDAVKLKLFEFTQAVGGPQGIAALTDTFIKHMDDFIVVGAVIALTTLPALIKQVQSLATALLAVNPIIAIAGIEALVIYFTSGAKDIKEFFLLLKLGFADLTEKIENATAKFYELDAALPRSDASRDFLIKQAAAHRQAATDAAVHARALILTAQAEDDLDRIQEKAGNDAVRRAKAIAAAKKLEADLEPKQKLAELNAEYRRGSIDAAEYNKKILDFDLYKARYQFKEGKITLDQLNETIRKVDLLQLERQFLQGTITVEEFTRASRNVELSKLKDQLNQGKISIEEFNSKLAGLTNDFSATGALRTGLTDYLKAVGTTTQQVAGLVKNTFTQLEDSMLDFIHTGTFNFAKFTQAILDDLTRIIIRAQIIQPLAQGLLNFSSTPDTSGAASATRAGSQFATPNAFAKGAAFDGNVKYFAKGDIFSSPTAFSYGQGKTGVMGERGPEAVIPLKRGAGGALGVAASVNPVNINIINQAGADVQQSETTGPNGEKQIDIMITRKVREGIANGKFDKAMRSTYGVTRKGV